MPFKTKRIYDPPARGDGLRVLVDRLWPRGVSREAAQVDLWLKECSPSTALRKKFHGHPEKWEHFKAAYFHELEAEPCALDALFEPAQKGTVTLLYASKDTEHNNAEALREYLQSHTHV